MVRRWPVKNISMSIKAQTITGDQFGPSGCGKSTFIRCLNRMHEVSHGGRTEGCIMLDGKDLYARDADLRHHPPAVDRHGFSRNPPLSRQCRFLIMSRRSQTNRFFSRRWELEEVVEKSLRRAALWDEVKDKLHQSGASLSGGQQQRLCIAARLPWSRK